MLMNLIFTRIGATSSYYGWEKFVSSYSFLSFSLAKSFFKFTCDPTTVKNVMQDRGQEPYIAFKLANIMREANFEIIKVDQRDTYLGNNRFNEYNLRNLLANYSRSTTQVKKIL